MTMADPNTETFRHHVATEQRRQTDVLRSINSKLAILVGLVSTLLALWLLGQLIGGVAVLSS